MKGPQMALLPSGKVLAVGDNVCQNAELYDPATGAFQNTGALNHPRWGASAVTLQGGKVLVIGGDYNPCSTCAPQPAPPELYDPATGSFSIIAAPPAPLGNFPRATVLSNGDVFLTGLGNTYLFDPSTSAYTTLSSCPTGDSYAQVLLPNGDFFVVGGDSAIFLGNSSPNASALIYHFASNQWETLSGGPRTWNPAAILLPSGKVLVTGGGDCCGPAAFYRTYLFDPVAKTFTSVAEPQERTGGRHTSSLAATS
jgi:hypothetical protein